MWQDDALIDGDNTLYRESFAGTLRRRRARRLSTYPLLRSWTWWDVSNAAERAPVLAGIGLETAKPVAAPITGVRRRGAPRVRQGAERLEAEFERIQRGCVMAMQDEKEGRVLIVLSDAAHLDSSFLERLDDILLRTALPAARLDLALSECVLDQDEEALVRALGVLRDAGCGVWFSHFGCGVSSLTRLRELAASGLLTGVTLDTVRLAPPSMEGATFASADGVGLEGEALDFLHGVVAAVSALGLSVSLEGVDNRAIFDQGLQAGCSMMSGAYFGADAEAQRLAAPPGGQAVRRRAGRR